MDVHVRTFRVKLRVRTSSTQFTVPEDQDQPLTSDDTAHEAKNSVGEAGSQKTVAPPTSRVTEPLETEEKHTCELIVLS